VIPLPTIAADPKPHRVPAAAASARLIDHLREHLVVVPVNELSELITAGAVTVNGARADVQTRLRAGDVLALDAAAFATLAADERLIMPFDAPVAVLFEDHDLLVLDKPSGMHVHPLGKWRSETLDNALVHRSGARAACPWGEWRPHPAHRLDRPASGLIVVAKSGAIRDSFGRLIEGRHVHRTYLARATGSVAGESGTIDRPIGADPENDYRRAPLAVADGGQIATTHWKVVARENGFTRMEMTLDTGRTHQIRVHLASIGHPIAGDTLYLGGPGSPNAPEIALHAARLRFPHPRTGGPMQFESAPPTTGPWKPTA
jgi:23S rRNA pseudouridine1911/1915/1917 synthase